MTRLYIGKAILAVLAAILTVFVMVGLTYITYVGDPVKERVIVALGSCSAGIATLCTIMLVLDLANFHSATSSGSSKTKTENATSNSLHRFATAKPSRKTWKNRLNGFSMHAQIMEPQGGGSTNKEKN